MLIPRCLSLHMKKKFHHRQSTVFKVTFTEAALLDCCSKTKITITNKSK